MKKKHFKFQIFKFNLFLFVLLTLNSCILESSKNNNAENENIETLSDLIPGSENNFYKDTIKLNKNNFFIPSLFLNYHQHFCKDTKLINYYVGFNNFHLLETLGTPNFRHFKYLTVTINYYICAHILIL